MALRIVQVGMGGFGRGWASEVIPEVKGVELAACVDLDPISLEKARTLLDLPADRYFQSLEEALELVPCEAVLCTTTLAGHMPVTTAALNAGKHVLVEKPFAPTLEEAGRAVDLAAARGLVLAVSQNYRFFPAVRAVQELIAGGSLGRVDTVFVDFRRYDNAAPRDGHIHYRVPQPVLVDMSIHHFDLMRVVLQREPKEIYCVAWNPPESKFDDPPVAVAVVRFEDDIVVSYRGSWISHGAITPWAGEWRMELTEAEIAWTSRIGGSEGAAADAVAVRRLGQEPEPIALPRVEYLDRAGSLSAFACAIETGTEPEIAACDNLRTLALTLAALKSAQTGVPVLIEGASH
jgi:predicted dehydrogenase